MDAPFYDEFEAAYRELLVHPAIRVPEPPHLALGGAALSRVVSDGQRGKR